MAPVFYDRDMCGGALNEQFLATIQSLQATIEKQNQLLEKLSAENAELRRILFGKKREKMPPKDREVKKRRGRNDPEKSKKKRRERAEAKKQLPTERVEHEVREDATTCPHCGGHIGDDLGEGDVCPGTRSFTILGDAYFYDPVDWIDIA